MDREREDSLDKRKEFLSGSNFQTWAFKDCGLQNVFIPVNISISDGYFRGFWFSFHYFKKLFRYRIEPEYNKGSVIIEVRKSEGGPEHVQDSAEINAEYRKDISTGEISIIDYRCTNETEQEEYLEQVKYLIGTLFKYGVSKQSERAICGGTECPHVNKK